MPVKNKNRQSNSGYEGVITGLNDEEKKVLEDAGIGGGDIWLDITPYLNEDMASISQEGYDLVYNAFYSGVENPVNKYVGIVIMGQKYIFNGLTVSDSDSNMMIFNFIFNIIVDGVKGSIRVSIYNDKSFEMLELPSSNKIWYEISSIKNSTITQDEYDELTNLINGDKLAGIRVNNEGYFTLFTVINGNYMFLGYNTTIGLHYAIISSNLRTTEGYQQLVMIDETPSSQVIPSITTSKTQQNLTIGDGLKIENGALKAAVSNKIWFDVASLGDYYLTEEQYNTLVSYAKNDLLAGINNGGFFIPLQGISDINSAKPTLTFEGWYLSIGLITITINGEDRKVDFNTKAVLMSPTTSLSSQVIPSITTSNTQQNLSIGDGLKIENGVLKANNIPALPSDASTKTYTLKAVNGVLTWVEG